MTDNWHKAMGVIVYDPDRKDMKKRTEKWCVINVLNDKLGTSEDLTRYYRWWVAKERHIHHLNRPAWGAHISVVRGEMQLKEEYWKKYNGVRLEIKYRHYPRVSGDTTGGDRPDYFWFVDIDCPLIHHIRQELGLPISRNGKIFTYHMTFGRTYY